MKLDENNFRKLAGTLIACPAIVITCMLHSFFIRTPNAVGFDDGYTVAAGERLIDGRWLPYVDACSHRGPILYWLAALAQWISGRFNWLGPRYLMLVVSLTTVAGLLGVGFFGRLPLAGAVASLLYVYMALLAIEADSAFAVTGEAIAASFGILAFGFCVYALGRSARPRARNAALVLSGCCAALAGLTKQTALLVIMPLALWTLAVACSDAQIDAPARRRMLLALAGGFFLPIVVVLARYAIAGELRTFWYWFYTYNVDVYMEPFRASPPATELNQFLRQQPWLSLLIAGLTIVGLARPVAEMTSFPRGFWPAYARSGLETTSSLLVLVAFAGLASPRRFWPPYLILICPFLAIALAIRIELVIARARGHWAAQLAAQLLLGTLLVAWVGYTAGVRWRDLVSGRKTGQRQTALPEPVCDLFARYSGPQDSVFIWGFDADFYVTCHRHPATRFTYLTLVAGAVPPFWQDLRTDRIARGAREHLMADLATSRPKVILDSPGTMRNVSLQVVPELVELLKRSYCPRPTVRSKNGRNAAVWVLRQGASCEDEAAGP